MNAIDMRGQDGKLISYAWPGGYPILYFDKDGCSLCPDCANKPDEYSAPVVAGDIYYEGPAVQCEDCGKMIESAYGDPFANEEETEEN